MTDLRIRKAASPFVAISDLIELFESTGTEYSVAVGEDARTLVVADPGDRAYVATIDLTMAGAWLRTAGSPAPEQPYCLDCATTDDNHYPGCIFATPETTRPLITGVVSERAPASMPSTDMLDKIRALLERNPPTVAFMDDEATPPGPAPAALPPVRAASFYTDATCPDCGNAMTLSEVCAGKTICDVCARNRRYIIGRIQHIGDADGSLSLHDPLSDGYVNTTSLRDSGAGYMEVTVRDISVPPQWRGHRIGSGLLASLTEVADEAGVVLHLEVAIQCYPPARSGIRDYQTLRAWYERHGFVTNESAHGKQWMIRAPRRERD